ncbi:sodium/calcium exchanger 2-like isoform X3 [Apostichopus japonicus]|uniref:sodium/calcium exchanger 2-like isoform X3 n=1 Tax=Stichopus japonicus TaxID=307972 RepID=UPI003AB5568D
MEVDDYIFCNRTDRCESKGLILPLTDESDWNEGFRAFLYFAGLIWSFFAVAIIADIFMCSIEVITSKTSKLKIATPQGKIEEVEIRVWNDTVANLTLMALGSSAPEIILSIIEIMGNGFKSGELGPSTIVGSAAFNLLVISAVCVASIPESEVRRVKLIKVFAVTASFSMFAYVWLFLVLQVISPNIVDVWEAVFTFMCFPLLVVVAYIIDKDFCGVKGSDMDVEADVVVKNSSFDVLWRSFNSVGDPSELSAYSNLTSSQLTKKKVADFMKEVGKHPDLDEETIAKLIALEAAQHEHHSRAWYRVNATRGLTGGSKVQPALDGHVMELYHKIKNNELAPIRPGTDLSKDGTLAVVEFVTASVAVFENEKKVRVEVDRYGLESNQVQVKYETVDGTAEANSDYVPAKGTLVFEAGETSKYIDIEIIDDYEWEPDETFFVKLTLDTKENTMIGRKTICEVTIINDDDPGKLEFAKNTYLVKESIGSVIITVNRVDGSDGKVEVKWTTKDIEAVNGSDYIGGEGILIFEHGEREKNIEIPIIDDQEYEKDESFEIELSDPSPGADLGRLKKTVVTIINDDDYTGVLDRVVAITHINIDRLRIGNSSYADQFRDALNVNGGDVENSTTIDYVLHFITIYFKTVFACVPPPNFLNSGGYICFVVSLCFIAILTALISDLASIFGCLVSLEDSITAITLVALGTSLPDTFASRTAALNEKYADNSIGNVTGSNSVNVFLGLGLPWLIASVYWAAKGDTFSVPAGSLAFSVAVFTVCAVVCIALLMVRRNLKFFGSAELGGPKWPKIGSAIFLVSLWLLYIILSIVQVYTSEDTCV